MIPELTALLSSPKSVVMASCREYIERIRTNTERLEVALQYLQSMADTRGAVVAAVGKALDDQANEGLERSFTPEERAALQILFTELSGDEPEPELINADSPLTQEMLDKGRKAWADVPSASAWVESLRGGDDTANLQSNGNTQ